MNNQQNEAVNHLTGGTPGLPDGISILKDIPDIDMLRERVHAGLRTYNDASSPEHRILRGKASQTYDCFLIPADGDPDAPIAALLGEFYWNAMEIDRLFVEEEYRGRGLARFLMAGAEAEARSRGCSYLHLTTFSFQAPDFYKSLGFRIVGTMEDFPPGMSKFWMRKDL